MVLDFFLKWPICRVDGETYAVYGDGQDEASAEYRLQATLRVNIQEANVNSALLSIGELGRFLGVGETTAKLLVRRGEVLSVKIGDRRLVPRASAQAYVDRLIAEATGERELQPA